MNHELLFQLLEVHSPSGHEERMKAFLSEYLKAHEIRTQDLGPAGLSWEIGEGSKLALFSAHADQVSFVVERVDEEGYLYIRMSSIDPRVVPSQEVMVWGKRALRGVVGMLPLHFV
ncbi:hypothetical protein KAX21_01620, partial [candidate division WOR-3 bacterium]|nr:hypothetical protein [candidate division WOR-3 bacterium]